MLLHRGWRVFREVIGATENPIVGSVWEWHGEEHEPLRRNPVAETWTAALRSIANTALFRVYIYLAVAIALLIGSRSRTAITILASGLIYQLSLFIAAPSPDYRYSHWMITCTVLAAVIIFCERLAMGRNVAKP